MKKNLNRLATLALTGILMTGMSFGALADNEAATTTDGIATTTESSLQIKKELGVIDVDDAEYNATVPHVKFSYSVSGVTGNELGTVGDRELVEGGTSDATPRKTGIGRPTATEVEFVTTDTATDKKVERYTTVDFGNITSEEWKESGAGVYRYKLTETDHYQVGNGYDYEKAMASSENDNNRYIDVYVGERDNGTFGIIGYVVSKTTTDGGKTDGYEVTIRTEGGTTTTTGDVYQTYDLKVTKTVTGTLGDKTKDFAFTTSTFKVPSGARFGYKKDNDSTRTEIADTETSVSSNLKNKESFMIQGIPVGQALTVTETKYADDGYETYVAVDEEVSATDTLKGNFKEGLGENNKTGATTVNFLNKKNETTPTGVVMDIAPYAAMILGAGAFAGVFLGRKKSEDEE